MDRRAFVGSTAAAAAALFTGTGALGQAAGSEPDLSFVHPELRAYAKPLAQANIVFSAANLNQLRSSLETQAFETLATAARPATGQISVREQRVAVPGGPEVLLHIINAAPAGARPAILHMHGGGYVAGSAKADLPALRNLAAQLDCVIASVEYRLAPETRWTGSVEDNYAGLGWIHRNAAELGIDRRRIAVMGESAGGGHAALLALAARDRAEVALCFQVLIYPMLDDRTGSSQQPGKNIGTLGWTAASNRFGWESFLGMKPGGLDVPAAAVPSRASSLAGLPPTFIGVGGIDLFVEEDVTYARSLLHAGVSTELLVVPGAYHGFDVFAPSTNVAKRFTAAKVDALRRAFAVTSSAS